MAAGIVLCIAVSALLVRPLVLDIPYLSHPETMYLSDLEFEADTNYEYGQFYKLRGIDAAGKMHSFDTSEERMEEGQELVQASDQPVYARATYLPHTKTVMSLEYIAKPDTAATESSTSSSGLLLTQRRCVSVCLLSPTFLFSIFPLLQWADSRKAPTKLYAGGCSFAHPNLLANGF